MGVLDAVGSKAACIWAEGWSGPLGMFLAARYPDRFERLVLTNTFAKLEESDDHPFGVPHDVVAAGRKLLIETWGEGATLDLLGLPHDDVARKRYAEYERSAITRGDLADLIDIYLAIDVRHLLRRVDLPTLVLHEANHLISEDQARCLANGIAPSRLELLERPLLLAHRGRRLPGGNRHRARVPDRCCIRARPQPRAADHRVPRHRRVHTTRPGARRSSMDRRPRAIRRDRHHTTPALPRGIHQLDGRRDGGRLPQPDTRAPVEPGDVVRGARPRNRSSEPASTPASANESTTTSEASRCTSRLACWTSRSPRKCC